MSQIFVCKKQSPSMKEPTALVLFDSADVLR